MTAIVILNIVFAVFVLVAMLSLLGRAIVSDHRATGARLDLAAWSIRSGNQPRSGARRSAAPAAPQVTDWPTATLPGK